MQCAVYGRYNMTMSHSRALVASASSRSASSAPVTASISAAVFLVTSRRELAESHRKLYLVLHYPEGEEDRLTNRT